MQDNQAQQDVTTKTEWVRPQVEAVDFDATQNAGFAISDGDVSTGS